MSPLATLTLGAGIGLAMLAMTACAQDPERQQQAQAALAAQDDAQCRAHGIEPLSSEYADCMNMLAYQRQQQRARVSDSLRGVNGGLPNGAVH